MHSHPLKQAVILAVDTLGMKGPVERRVAAEDAYRAAPSDYWAAADDREARIQYLMGEVTSYMREPHGQDVLERILSKVPKDLWPLIAQIPRYICISVRGGRGSQHVMSWRASPEDWDKNMRLKEYVAEHTFMSTKVAYDVRNLLKTAHAASLEDLLTREAA